MGESATMGVRKRLPWLRLVGALFCCSLVSVNFRRATLVQREMTSSKPENASIAAKKNRSFIDVLKRGFVFSRLPTQFLLEVAYAESTHTPDTPLYTKEEMKMIERAMYTMLGFMNQPLWSGHSAHTHFIGTGSCLVKLKRPAEEVAVGVMHGLYLQDWQQHVRLPRDEKEECDMRHRLRQVLGSQLERSLWLDTGLHGNGPWSTCLPTMSEIFRQAEANPTVLSIDYLRDLPIHMLLCDEIEEAMGGDGIMSGHWKRRNTEFFDNLVGLAAYLDEPDLVNWIQIAREMSHAIHHPNPGVDFKELTPLGSVVLYDTVTFSPDANPRDVQRWKDVMNTTQLEQQLSLPYLSPRGPKNIIQHVEKTRRACDRVQNRIKINNRNTTVDAYLKKFQTFKSRLSFCEKNDTRFRDTIPMPEEPPIWAIPPEKQGLSPR
jgi:hypothetical protein